MSVTLTPMVDCCPKCGGDLEPSPRPVANRRSDVELVDCADCGTEFYRRRATVS
jgi:hypothetical protein